MVWYWGLTRFHSIRVPVFLLVMICGSVICRWARNNGEHVSSKMPDLSLSAAPIFCDILRAAPLRISSSSWQRMKPNKTENYWNKQTKKQTNKQTRKLRNEINDKTYKTKQTSGEEFLWGWFLISSSSWQRHRVVTASSTPTITIKDVSRSHNSILSKMFKVWKGWLLARKYKHENYITLRYCMRLQSTHIFSGSKYPNWWNDRWVTLPEMWRQTERNQFQLCHKILFRQILNIFMQRIEIFYHAHISRSTRFSWQNNGCPPM